jgi:hypothetical protein
MHPLSQAKIKISFIFVLHTSYIIHRIYGLLYDGTRPWTPLPPFAAYAMRMQTILCLERAPQISRTITTARAYDDVSDWLPPHPTLARRRRRSSSVVVVIGHHRSSVVIIYAEINNNSSSSNNNNKNNNRRLRTSSSASSPSDINILVLILCLSPSGQSGVEGQAHSNII